MEVKWWLGRARNFDLTPDIIDKQKYGRQVVSWWHSIQPTWRKGDGALPRAVYIDNSGDSGDGTGWETLTRGGPNGFFIIMLMFCWWGLQDRDSQEWKAATADLQRCIERMAVRSEKRRPEPIGEVSRAEKAAAKRRRK